MDRVILGIGNPGSQYACTRHNIGFRVIDEIVKLHGLKFQSSKFKALVAEMTKDSLKFLLVKPLTYVNLSGQSAQLVLDWYKIEMSSLFVIVDDLSLPVGKIRIRQKGSSGGHHGLDSIINSLGTIDFARLRVGIGDTLSELKADYVLSKFFPEEEKIIEESIAAAIEAIFFWAKNGVDATMNKYNSR